MTLHQFSIRLRQGRKLGVLRNTRPQSISFPRFSTPSFPFCSVPQTENSELKILEFSLRFNRTTIFLLNCVTSRILIKLRGFVFVLYPKPKTRRWKTSEFDLIITVLSVVKTRSRKTSEADQSTSEFDQNTSEKICVVFISEFSVLAIVQNGKGKPRKNILRGFRDF